MKKLLLTLILGTFAFGCSPRTGKPHPEVKETFKSVEYGTGKLLEGTGNLIKAGVGSAKEGWKTGDEPVNPPDEKTEEEKDPNKRG